MEVNFLLDSLHLGYVDGGPPQRGEYLTLAHGESPFPFHGGKS